MVEKILNLIKKPAILYSIANMLFLSTIFLADVIVARTYSLEQVGGWKQLILLVQFTATLLSFGFIEGFRYNIAKHHDKIKELLGTVMFIFILISAVIFAFLSFDEVSKTFGELLGINVIIKAGFLIPLLYFLLSANGVYLQVCLSIGKINVILISMVVFCITLAASLFIFLINNFFDFQLNIFLPFLLALGLQLITYLVILKIYPQINMNRINISMMLRYGFPLFIATYLGMFTLHIDKVIINKIGGLSEFAIYSIGALEIPFAGLITKSIVSVSYPKIVKHVENDEIDLATDMWLHDVKKASYFIFPLVFACILFSKQIILGLFGTRYASAVPVFEGYCLILIWRNATYGTLLSIKGKTNYIAISSLISLIINIVFIYFFYNVWGIVGIVRAVFISVVFLVIITLYLENNLKKYVLLFKDKWLLGLLIAIFILYFLKQ
ncbi:O-antigen/teichoic acid export membrane protein [Chryseobacterium sp. 7]|uniref:lipopolysaccharide biosynthesis protein n=1 Tax=Chryseobacterium sp. 7 TaxID=2035214 RepID=UPI000EB0F8B6|nr:oligosaccharide flippase family protein [Chryseobacterium sp. 7]RLJ33652.1 O-antigen/teichoic acid export membrane protein [Chryseobacterium sp. 7]